MTVMVVVDYPVWHFSGLFQLEESWCSTGPTIRHGPRNSEEFTTDLERHPRYRLRCSGDFHQARAFGGGGLYRGGGKAGSRAGPRRRSMHDFTVHFESDKVHAEQGVLSTDEPTERRRWHMIVKGVLPEVAEPDRAFDELWDHFSRPDSWRCYPDVGPVLDALAEQRTCGVRRLEFRRPLERCRQGASRAGEPYGVAGHFVGSRLPKTASVVFSCGLRPAWPAAIEVFSAWVTTRKTMSAARCGRACRRSCCDRGADCADDLPHVPNLTALLERKLGES